MTNPTPLQYETHYPGSIELGRNHPQNIVKSIFCRTDKATMYTKLYDKPVGVNGKYEVDLTNDFIYSVWITEPFVAKSVKFIIDGIEICNVPQELMNFNSHEKVVKVPFYFSEHPSNAFPLYMLGLRNKAEIVVEHTSDNDPVIVVGYVKDCEIEKISGRSLPVPEKHRQTLRNNIVHVSNTSFYPAADRVDFDSGLATSLVWKANSTASLGDITFDTLVTDFIEPMSSFNVKPDGISRYAFWNGNYDPKTNPSTYSLEGKSFVADGGFEYLKVTTYCVIKFVTYPVSDEQRETFRSKIVKLNS